MLTRTRLRLKPDAARTLSRLFVPGQETAAQGDSPAQVVIDRVLAISEDEIDRTLARTRARFADRYRSLDAALEINFGSVAHRLGGGTVVSDVHGLRR